MRRKIFLPALLLIFVALASQEKRGVDHFGVDDGLSQGSVFDLIQDDQGFLWAATADGLNRFDGYGFKVFKNNPGDSFSLRHTHLRGILNGKNALWITTSGTLELYRLDLLTQKFSLIYEDPNSGIAKELLAFKEDHDTVWILVAEKGILKLNWKTKTVIEAFPDAVQSYPSGNVVVYDSLSATVWYADYSSSGLNSFDLGAHQYRHREFSKPNHVDSYEVSSIAPGGDSILWIGADNSVLAYNHYTEVFQAYSIPTAPEISEAVISLLQTDSSHVWCGTERGFIFLLNPLNGKFSVVRDPNTGSAELAHRNTHFMIDHSRNVWVGTDPDGIYRIDTKEKPFHHTHRIAGVENTLKNNFTKCFLCSGNETYIGTHDNGICVYDNSTSTYRNINGFDNSPGHLPTVSGMFEDSSGTIWCSTGLGVGLLRKGKTFLERPVMDKADVRIESPARTIYQLDAATILVGLNTGLYSLSAIDSKWRLTSVPITTLVEQFMTDHSGNLWMSSSYGIYFCMKSEIPMGLSLIVNDIGRVKCITETTDGVIWAGSENGLYKLDPVTRKVIRTYSEADGMPNNFVYGILPDTSGNLWISTNRGLTRFNRATETFRNYSVTDGLQSNEFNTGAFYATRNGELFFGGVNGYNHFYPNEIVDNPYPPRSVITGFSVFDKPLATDTSIEYKKHLTLGYTQNNILLEYTALEFSDPGKNHFKYRMLGIDTHWVEAGKERFARFVNLDAGEYIFEVKAANNDGLWNNEPTRLWISITPPFWQTSLFIISVLTIGILLGVVSIRFYFRRQLKVRTHELQLKQSVRMNAIIETEEKERKRIAGELHDGLGQLLSTAKLNVAGFGENIDPKDTVLLNNSLQLLDQACEEVRTISHNMMPGALIRMGLMAAVNELIIKINDTEKLKVEYDTNLEERFSENIEIALYRIIQEALNNMVKHSEAKTILLRIEKISNRLEVTIADDGKSFDVAEIQTSSGLGWKNIHSRVEILDGTIRVESAKGKGTSIFITIPLNAS